LQYTEKAKRKFSRRVFLMRLIIRENKRGGWKRERGIFFSLVREVVEDG